MEICYLRERILKNIVFETDLSFKTLRSNIMATVIPYFSTTVAVFSTVGLNNAVIGLMVAGILGEFSVLVLVVIANSVAGCLANGLSYYAYIADYPTANKAVASVFADLAWLVSVIETRFVALTWGIHIPHLNPHHPA
jgi:hypothetical protein